jgi:hypothetical protein
MAPAPALRAQKSEVRNQNSELGAEMPRSDFWLPRPRRGRVVGLGRFELPTSRLSSARSNQLSYKPVSGISNQQSGIRTNFAHLIPDFLPTDS